MTTLYPLLPDSEHDTHTNNQQGESTMEINKQAIEQAVIQTVSDSIIADSDLESSIRAAVNARIDTLFKARAEQQINEAIDRAIADGFEHEYRRVDSFGNKAGEPTTIRKELERIIAGYWNQMVDRNGKPSDSSYGCVTRAEYFMTHLVAADFSGEMKQHIVNIGGSLKDALRGELHGTVNRLLSDVFHVKSEGDQKLSNPGRSCIDPAQTGKA